MPLLCNTPNKVKWYRLDGARMWAELNGEYVYPCRSKEHYHTAHIRTSKDRAKARYWSKRLKDVA